MKMGVSVYIFEGNYDIHVCIDWIFFVRQTEGGGGPEKHNFFIANTQNY